MKCRVCKTPKWRTDPCLNPDCPKNLTTTIQIRGRSLPTTATVKHGYHAPMTTTTSLVSEYDAPIRAKNWRTVA